MQAYIATVKILVAAPSSTDACDAISAALGDPINTALVDWGYISRAPDTCTSGCPHTEGAQSGGKCRCVIGGYIPTADGNPPMPSRSTSGDKDFAYPERHADLDPATYIEGSFLLTPVS